MAFSVADRVWNRAAIECGGPSPREGDRALSDMLLAHAMVMHGGLAQMFENLSEEELVAAAMGFDFFGLRPVSKLLIKKYAGDELKNVDDRWYWEFVKDDSDLVKRFEVIFEAAPEYFAPLR